MPDVYSPLLSQLIEAFQCLPGVGSKTGLSVVALQRQGELLTQLTAETVLSRHAQLLNGRPRVSRFCL